MQGALARFDDFLTNPLIQGHSGTAPETSQDNSSIKHGAKEDDSQRNPHHEAGIFYNQMTQNSGSGGDHDMVTGVQKESLCGHDMVTGGQKKILCGHHMVRGVQRESLRGHDMVTRATEQIRNRHDMTRVHEEVTYCSASTSSGKQKKNRSTSQLQFRSENTPATIEADQNLLAFQQLAKNNKSANFRNNIKRIFKLPKSLTTTMPTFDEKYENFELFEDLFQPTLKIHNQLTEEDRINYFRSLIRGDALQTFKSINGPTRENLREVLAVYRWKYVKPQSMATAKHKLQKLVFNPANHKLVDSLNELQQLAEDAFGNAARAIIDQFIYTKTPPHLKKSINRAHLENGTYGQIVTHLERERELNGLEAPDELQINTVSHDTANTNAGRRVPTCHHCKKPGQYKNQRRLLKIIKIFLKTKAVTPIPLTRTVTSTIIKTITKTVTEPKESQKLLIYPVRHVVS